MVEIEEIGREIILLLGDFLDVLSFILECFMDILEFSLHVFADGVKELDILKNLR